MYINSISLQTVLGWCGISLMSLFLGKPVYGIEISPMVTALSIDSRANYQQFLITNNSNLTLPVEIDVNEIEFNPLASGASYKVISETSTDLLVFPPATVLAPGAVQSVRVQWLGQDTLANSQSYFIRFSQPQLVDDSASKSGVKIFVHFNAAVHVSSSKQQPQLVINTSSIQHQIINIDTDYSLQKKQQNTSSLLKFTVDNIGNKYATLNDYYLNITEADGNTFTIEEEALVTDQINTFFPPHSKREVSINIGRVLSKGFSLAINPVVR
ncbi:hypothetical protein AB4140_08425 [Shewanella sp. 10N.286.51.B2]|uniref:hypothetical protein n=1 Tax=Shewanella sp. 10N.286.51.B2 TaxID=3229707 RepID=UPI00355087E3